MKRIVLALIVVALLAWPALAALTNKDASVNNVSARASSPTSIVSNWVDLCSDIATADNSGNTVLNPSNITRAAQGKLAMLGSGTTVQWRIKYTTGLTITACTIQPFGFDVNSTPERLLDSTGTHALAFVSDSANDVQDGTKSYTASQETDANGAFQVMGAIKVLATGTGAATGVLQVRVK